MKKKFATTSIVLLAASTLAACSAGENVATLEGGQVSKDEMYDAMKATVGEETLQELLLAKVLDKEVGENTFAEDAKAEVATTMASFGGPEAFAQSLTQFGFKSIEDYEKAIHMTYLMQEAVKGRTEITDEEVAAYYETWEPGINAAHILVEDEQLAKDLIQQINEGADFATLAQENSKDGSAQNGGDIGYFGRGEMVPEFEEAAYALEVDQVTQEPVQSQFGFHIIKLLDKPAKGSLEEEKENVREIMFEEKAADPAHVNSTLSAIIEDANVDIKDEDLEGALAPFLPQEAADPAASGTAPAESATSESAAE